MPRLYDLSLHQHRLIPVAIAVLLSTSSVRASTTVDTTFTDGVTSTVATTADSETGTAPSYETTTLPTTSKASSSPFTIRVPPLEDRQYQSLPHFLIDLKEGGELQDIGAEESSNNMFIHIVQETHPKPKEVQVSSFVADSEAVQNLNVRQAMEEVRNRSGNGADMISAFFVAPEDEVFGNNIYRKNAEERRDNQRPERDSDEETDEKHQERMILAPLQAAVSLSHDSKTAQEQPIIEKQTLHEMPVYKTTIEIQKSIPYEIKGEQMQAVDERPNQKYAFPSPPVTAPVMLYHVPQYRTPLYYKVPMYYIPQPYIGNYIMKHSHENTGGVPNYYYRPRQYYYLKYPVTGSGTALPPASGYPQQMPSSPVFPAVPNIPGTYPNIQLIPAVYTADYPAVQQTLPETNNHQKRKTTLGKYQKLKQTVKTTPLREQKASNEEYNNEKNSQSVNPNSLPQNNVVYNAIPQTEYQSVRSILPSNYQNLRTLPLPEQETGYPTAPHLPLNYQTLKVVPAAYANYPAPQYPEQIYYDGGPELYQDEDQNSLQSEQQVYTVSKKGTELNSVRSSTPFRPSQHAFSSVYPPYTYKVPLMLTEKTGRGIHARSVRSKQLCVEYGGFKPPMVPSVQIDEHGLPKKAEQRSDPEIEQLIIEEIKEDIQEKNEEKKTEDETDS